MNPIAVPTPGQSAPAQAVPQDKIAEPFNRWQALRQAGWWKGVDTVLVALVTSHLITGFFFLVFGKLTFSVAVLGFLQCITLFVAWAVILAYRCMDFVLNLRANIELLPFDSARIAVGFLQGGKPLETPVKR